MKLRYERTSVGWNVIAGWGRYFAEAEAPTRYQASLWATCRCYLMSKGWTPSVSSR